MQLGEEIRLLKSMYSFTLALLLSNVTVFIAALYVGSAYSVMFSL